MKVQGQVKWIYSWNFNQLVMKERTCNLDDFPLSRNKDKQGLKFWFCTQIQECIPLTNTILVYITIRGHWWGDVFERITIKASFNCFIWAEKGN